MVGRTVPALCVMKTAHSPTAENASRITYSTAAMATWNRAVS